MTQTETHTHLHRAHAHTHARTHARTHTAYRICLVLPAVELVTVVEDVFIGGVETGFDTVLHHLTGSGGTL
jgi:hypothetical protein